MRAVQAHYDRIGVKAVVSMGQYPGLYVTSYQMPEDLPLISVIIPNKDHAADLDQCLESIFQKIRYPRYEILIIENNSVERETFAYYERLQNHRLPGRVLTWKEEFNFSRINNFGAEEAKGDYLLFLNNDTEIISQDCFEQLLGPALRREVGAVGARLFYGDNTIQHAGVVIGYGGIAGHAFQGKRAEENGYFSRIICQSDLSAVTAACMLVRRDAFEEVGGFDPQLAVAFNDIDFCLRLRERGYLIVYNPFAVMIHYESKSRGMEDSAGKIARFNSEADELLRRWGKLLKDGDPYYNPNLSLDRVDFGLKKY
jgi:GT2 family glycosyltransferase